MAFLFFLRRFHLAFSKSSWLSESPFFVIFLSSSFPIDIKSMMFCSEAVNQSGLHIMVCLEASFAASMTCFWKRRSNSSFDTSAIIWGVRFWKNLETLS